MLLFLRFYIIYVRIQDDSDEGVTKPEKLFLLAFHRLTICHARGSSKSVTNVLT